MCRNIWAWKLPLEIIIILENQQDCKTKMMCQWFDLVNNDNELKDIIRPALLEILAKNLVLTEKIVMDLTDEDITSFQVSVEDLKDWFYPLQ